MPARDPDATDPDALDRGAADPSDAPDLGARHRFPPARLALRDGREATASASTRDDEDELLDLFCRIVADDEGYPQDPTVPVTRQSFTDYWLAPARVSCVARVDGDLAGAYTMKPNGYGLSLIHI